MPGTATCYVIYTFENATHTVIEKRNRIVTTRTIDTFQKSLVANRFILLF